MIRPGVVIPVRDDRAGLDRLLGRLAALDCTGGIVVVDDGSAEPVAPRPGVRVLRNPESLGPGPARNRGLQEVAEPHVLFLDADDWPTPELRHLLGALDGEAFDLCQFLHAEPQGTAVGRWGPSRWDARFWVRTGAADRALGDLAPRDRPWMARTANYPWHKVYRTDFLRAADIGFGASLVHEDVPPHWQALMRADRMLTSNRVAVWHGFDPAGGRLTNLGGPERLAALEVLETVRLEIAEPRPHAAAWRAAFARFAEGLMGWVLDGRIDDESRGPFEAGREALLDRMPGWAEGHSAGDPRPLGGRAVFP